MKTSFAAKIGSAISNSVTSSGKMNMGRRLSFSNGRRLVDDVIRVSNQMPMAAFSSQWDVAQIAKLRRLAKPKISWNVLMMKAHALVCQKNAMLRRIYVRVPYAHLYEHHQSVCMMTIGRKHDGEERLFFARFNEPDNYTLIELQELYDRYRKAPVEEIKQFRHQITFAKFPGPIRRFAWWALFNLWPQKRASHMGTFGMSISGHRGAFGSGHLGTNTTILGVDPNPRNGVAKMLLTFDHQIMDGVPATETLMLGQRMLATAVAKELADMAGVDQDTLQPLTEHQKREIRVEWADKKRKREELENQRRRNRRSKTLTVDAKRVA